VNDGSNEVAASAFNGLVEKYRDRGWSFITRENSFVGAARNRATASSTADYLLFVDADDIVAPNTLENMLPAITFSGDDCLVAGGLLFDSDDPPCDFETGKLSAPILATYMPLGPAPVCALVDPMVLGTSMIMVRQTAFQAIDGYRTVRGARGLPARSHTRLARQVRNCSWANFQGGKSVGNCRHWQPVFTTYSIASTTRLS
jgi:glycosyltransferase involved in cell wall biosynthesis